MPSTAINFELSGATSVSSISRGVLTCIEHAYPQAADRREAAVAPIGDSYPSIVRRLLAHESHEDWKGTLKMKAPKFIRQCIFEKLLEC
jgi:hypothetical protein